MGGAITMQKQRECRELVDEIEELCSKQRDVLAKHRRWGCNNVHSPDSNVSANLNEDPYEDAVNDWKLEKGEQNPRVPLHQEGIGFSLTTTRMWCREYQEITDRPIRTLDDRIARLTAMETLTQEFCSEFTSTVETIVREMYLPEDQQTLGGKSIIRHRDRSATITPHATKKKSVGFKDVLELPETCKLPPFDLSKAYHCTVTITICTDIPMAKRARNEYRAQRVLASCGVRGLAFPLLGLISVHGHTATIMAEPVTCGFAYGTTLRGRRRVVCNATEVPVKLRRGMEQLRLKGTSLAGDLDNVLWGPLEVEAYEGFDGGYHVMNLGNLFPHFPPPKGTSVGPSNVITLRPELLRVLPRPLSSCAFFVGGHREHRENDQDVRDAVKDVCQRRCRVAAKEWVESIKDCDVGNVDIAVSHCKCLVEFVHDRGINVALLGLVLRDVPQSEKYAYDIILATIVARTCKELLFKRFCHWELHCDLDAVRGLASGFLVELVQGGPLWGEIEDAVPAKFLGFPMATAGYLLRSPTECPQLAAVVVHVLQLCNLALEVKLPRNPTVDHIRSHPLEVSDVRPRMKHTGLLCYSPLSRPLALYKRGAPPEEVEKAFHDEIRQAEKAAEQQNGDNPLVIHLKQALVDFLMWKDGTPNTQRAKECERILREAIGLRERVVGCGTINEPYEVSIDTAVLGDFYMRYRAWNQAGPTLEKVCTMREEGVGGEHSEYASALLAYGIYHTKINRVKEAIEILNHALNVKQAARGELSPALIPYLTALAALYEDSSQTEAAEPLRARVLYIRVKTLGRMHIAVSTALNNLAVNLFHQQRYDDAEPLYRLDLEVCEKLLGPEHEDVATSMNNLASLYDVRGAYDKSEPLYRRDLEITTKRLGNDHPNTATSLNNLAASYAAQGRYDEALGLYQRCLDIRTKVYGASHPIVAETHNNLGALCTEQKKFEEAKNYYIRAIDIIELTEGKDSQRLTAILNNVQALCEALGEDEEAEVWSEKIMELKRLDTSLHNTIYSAERNTRGSMSTKHDSASR